MSNCNELKKAIYLGWEDCVISEEIHKIIESSFDLIYFKHCKFNDKVDQEALAKMGADFLFSFGPVILKKQLLEAPGLVSINFHTAPPKWPGRGSCSFALYEGDKDYGVTAHLMIEAVDAGPILKVLRFPITPQETVESLHQKTLEHIPRLMDELIVDLKKMGWKVKPSGEKWERQALKQQDLIRLMEIHDNESPEEISRKIKAFSHSKKPGPFLVKHGVKFWYFKGQSA